MVSNISIDRHLNLNILTKYKLNNKLSFTKLVVKSEVND